MSPWRQLRQLAPCCPPGNDLASRQAAWLQDCLSRNQHTLYGKKFAFADIHSIRDYQEAVPIVTYENLSDWISQIARGIPDVLFAGTAVALERTGGSTGGAKLVPYSSASFQDFSTAILPWLANLIETQGLDKGCAYWAISPATRQPESSDGGIPVGLPEGAYLGDAALSAIADLSAVPFWVSAIPDVATWQLVTLYWLLRREDLVLISVWSPTFFLMLLDAIVDRGKELQQVLTHGATVSGEPLPADAAAKERLMAYLAARDARSLWPELKVVSCWADGSSFPFFDQLRNKLPHAAFEGKGLLATEGVVTVPDREHRPVLASSSGFFEFLGDATAPLLAHELVSGERYEVIMTTAGGLYRYRLGDSVRCEGFVGDLPILRFLGRNGLVSDLVGEKLTEEFVGQCLADIPGFRMLAPVVAPRAGYVLVVDVAFQHAAQMRETVEERLSQNPQYAYALRVGQLSPMAVKYVENPLAAYTALIAQRGSRLGDIKVPALHPQVDWLQQFSGSPP